MALQSLLYSKYIHHVTSTVEHLPGEKIAEVQWCWFQGCWAAHLTLLTVNLR